MTIYATRNQVRLYYAKKSYILNFIRWIGMYIELLNLYIIVGKFKILYGLLKFI